MADARILAASTVERAALARSDIIMKMDGPKKSAKFTLMCNGE